MEHGYVVTKIDQVVILVRRATQALRFTIGYAKIRHRGLAKNTEWLALLEGLYNLKRSQGLAAG